jgi:hypothetical protein
MSSERNGLGDEASADDVPQEDSWFEPARHVPGAASADGAHPNGVYPDGLSADDMAADGTPVDGSAPGSAMANGVGPRSASQPADWFLRTGRAGLLPDSMTVSAEDRAPPEWRHEAAGAPPWIGEVVQADGEPPPWESRPWPGPGEETSEQTAAGQQPGPERVSLASGQDDTGRNWQARAALLTGVLPLILPGLVLGVLGLRQARYSRSGWAFSWLGIGLSVVWAVILGVVVFVSPGSTTGGCTVPSAVRAGYGLVTRDLSAANPGITSGTLATDARLAAGQANAAAASAGQVPFRSALAALAGELEQVQAAVPAGHAGVAVGRLPRTTRVQLKAISLRLSADESALSKTCAG